MEQTVHCHIFAAGSFSRLHATPAPSDFIIAADGGYLHCRKAGLQPALLIGDFDSLEEIPSGIETLRFPSEKDDTDTMLALKEGLRRGYRHFHLHACTGGRLDHTLANLQALAYLAKQGAQGFLYSEEECFTAISNRSYILPAPSGRGFSVFCLGEEAQGLSIKGAKYTLAQGSLSPHFPLGISNRVEGEATVYVSAGCLLISWLHH